MPIYPILTYIENNWTCVPAVLSEKWIILASPQCPGKTGNFLLGSVSWILHLLLSWHQLHIFCLSQRRKTPSRKRLSFKFFFLPVQTWEQVKHNFESSSLLNSRRKNKKSSSIFLEKQNKDSREKHSPHPIHLHNLCKYEEWQWPHYNIICCYLCIWEKCQGCVLLLLESGGKNLLGMGNREDSLPSQA